MLTCYVCVDTALRSIPPVTEPTISRMPVGHPDGMPVKKDRLAFRDSYIYTIIYIYIHHMYLYIYISLQSILYHYISPYTIIYLKLKPLPSYIYNWNQPARHPLGEVHPFWFAKIPTCLSADCPVARRFSSLAKACLYFLPLLGQAWVFSWWSSPCFRRNVTKSGWYGPFGKNRGVGLVYHLPSFTYC